MRELFWEGRDRTNRARELFLEGLLALTESLNDKTLGDGYLIVARGNIRNLEFYVPMGEHAREFLLKPTLRYMADTYGMSRVLLQGERGLADRWSIITVVLSDAVLAISKFPDCDRRVVRMKRGLEAFEEDMRAVCAPSPARPDSYWADTIRWARINKGGG